MGMSKSARLLYILNLLRARRNLNAARLAEECGVTERSIYRDIISLSEANIPIYYDNGYKLASDSFLPPLNFTVEEYLCLKTALESSPLNKAEPHRETLKAAWAKIEAVLPERVRREQRFHSPATHIDITSTQEEKKAERFYSVIENAISEALCLKMEYDSVNSGRSSRVVEPHFIIFRGRAFYFVAYCRLRREFRTFRMDRVVSIKPTDEHFRPHLGIRPEDYFEGSWEIYKGEPVDVVVRFTGPAARLVRHSRHHPREEVEEIDTDTIEYRVRVNGMDEIARWILGFGDQAEVIQPVALRDRLAEIGRYFWRVYDGSTPPQ